MHQSTSSVNTTLSLSPLNNCKVVSLLEWFQGLPNDYEVKNENNTYCHDAPISVQEVSPSIQRLPLIDLRSDEAFTECHLLPIDIFSTSNAYNNFNYGADNTRIIVNLPFHSLESGDRSCELPPRNVPFAILLPRNNDNYEESHQMDYHQTILNFFFATRSKATSQSRKPWLVKQIIHENDSLWNDARDLGILYESQAHNTNDKLIVPAEKQLPLPLPRLWRPDEMIQTILLPILKSKLHTAFKSMGSTAKHSPFIVCDLGSGAGRDVCFLAEELNFYLYQLLQLELDAENNNQIDDVTVSSQSSRIKLTIVGIDNHKGSEKRCIPFWKNRRVEHITQSLFLDLNKATSFRDQLFSLQQQKNEIIQDTSVTEYSDDNGIVCLYAIRFLNRKLIKYIANSNHEIKCRQDGDDGDECKSIYDHLRRGTIFAMSHFCKANSGASWNFDHPKVRLQQIV